MTAPTNVRGMRRGTRVEYVGEETPTWQGRRGTIIRFISDTQAIVKWDNGLRYGLGFHVANLRVLP